MSYPHDGIAKAFELRANGERADALVVYYKDVETHEAKEQKKRSEVVTLSTGRQHIWGF
jgi:hypothetical protein